MSSIKDTKVYNINDFINWNIAKELIISPKYQRNSVWNHKAQSYLIDTLIRGLPVPQIFIRQIIDVNTKTTKREIIDGQQRLRAIISFIGNEFEILKSHNSEYGGLKYTDLPDEAKESLLEYNLPVEIIKIKDESRIYDMFSRLNTNSVSLNKQELRNSRFWGEFKVFIYNISAEWREFYNSIKTFKDKDFSRMNDIEFNSSLIIHLLGGIITESATIIDNYYKKYDAEFSNLDKIEYKFNFIMKIIKQIFTSELFSSEIFHRKTYFYTLFCALNYHIFDIQGLDIQKNIKLEEKNINSNIDFLINKLMELESDLQKFLNEEMFEVDKIKIISRFEQNHKTRTTSAKERKERIIYLTEVLGRD